MRRAALVAAVSLVALVALSPAASGAEPPNGKVEFQLHEDGFLVSVRSEFSEEKIVLSLYRRGEVAYYETSAEITEDGLKARFGQFGELDYTFRPTRRADPCSGFAKGRYEGTFAFTGENEYVKFEAPNAPGTFLGSAKRGCKEPRRTTARVQQSGAREAWLVAHTHLPWPARSLLVRGIDGKDRRRVLLEAMQGEEVEGMLVVRGVRVFSAPPSAFTWNLDAGTAHLDPPAPFTGSATFKRRPGGRAIWRGSLRAPMLGGEPMILTGDDFQAQLKDHSILESD